MNWAHFPSKMEPTDRNRWVIKRDTGVEPVSQPWEGWAQPIYQSRSGVNCSRPIDFGQRFGGRMSDMTRDILEQVRAGKLGVDEAVAQLATPAVGELGFATVDLDRRARCGFPEVIYAEGKTCEWLEGVV